MEWILITVVSTVIVAVAKPIRLNADISVFTLEMVYRAGGVARTSVVCFIRRYIILAIVHSITDLRHGYATMIETGEGTIGAWRVSTVLFVGSISTVILVITFPGAEYTSSVVASELVRIARVVCAVVLIFVAVITTIIIAIASPHS